MGKIYSGPVTEFILEDAANGSYSIKELLEADYSEEHQKTELMDGNESPITRLHKLQVKIANTDATTLAELKKRIATRQTVRVLWLEVQIQMRNVFIQLSLARGYKPGEAHGIVVTAQTTVEDDVTLSNIYANPNGLEAFYDPYTQAGN